MHDFATCGDLIGPYAQAALQLVCNNARPARAVLHETSQAGLLEHSMIGER